MSIGQEMKDYECSNGGPRKSQSKKRKIAMEEKHNFKQFCFEMFKTVQVVNLKIVTDPTKLI